jgi:preprotein translocase subunit Sss1
MALAFNTLEYTKGAEKVGIKREHAEYQAEQIAKFVESNLATKNDIQDVLHKISEIEYRLTIKLGSLMLTGMGILGFVLSHHL